MMKHENMFSKEYNRIVIKELAVFSPGYGVLYYNVSIDTYRGNYLNILYNSFGDNTIVKIPSGSSIFTRRYY